MIIILHGPDSFSARRKLHFYRDAFKKKYDPEGLNIIHLDGAALSLDELRKHLGQVGFLASKRFIMIDNYFTQNKKKTAQKHLVEYLEKEWSDDNVIVFLEETDADDYKKNKNPFAKKFSRAKVEYFPQLAGEKLTVWIRKEVASRNARIDPSAAVELAALLGPDLWSQSAAIDKLRAFAGSDAISPTMVREMVRGRFDDNIFHLTDAIASRDAHLSLRLLEDQLASGSHELYILTMLTRQFRILLQVREIVESEPNHFTVASRLGLHPFVAQKAMRDVKKFSLDELKRIYAELLQIEIKLKTSQDSPRLLFDLFITRVCQAA